MDQQYHKPVLMNEVLELLSPQSGDVVVDATFGFGGHSKEIKKHIGPRGLAIAIEQDPEVFNIIKEEAKEEEIRIINGNFKSFSSILDRLNVERVDKILFDLGISSFHFDKAERGFSLKRDEPLDMRLSKEGITAAQILNGSTENELADLFYTLADEYDSRKIAKAIFNERRKKKFEKTSELVNLIEKLKGKGIKKIHPATKVFQALRIAVNDELNAISLALPQAINNLRVGGRIAVISFHSGEDRIVKNIFKTYERKGQINILTKKPVIASDEEIRQNPRSRSAKLRVAERI